MRYKWLHKYNNKKVIIFFNGWGMDESVVKHLDNEDFDILMFYDYNTIDTDFDRNELNNYSQKYLVSWSMGVMTATLFDIEYQSKTAINGTLKPIDDRYGIPERIYNLTLKGFSPKGAERFIKSMFYEDCVLPEVKREFENQKSELEALTHYHSDLNFRYDKIIISEYDKIIPAKNQTSFWNIEPNIKSGHAPFICFKKWGELL